MKKTIQMLSALALAGLWLGMTSSVAADKPEQKTKPYPLDKCVVSDEKLGEHGKPYVFTEKGQEVKLCCKDCLKDFKKDKAKYLKKIEDADKKK